MSYSSSPVLATTSQRPTPSDLGCQDLSALAVLVVPALAVWSAVVVLVAAAEQVSADAVPRPASSTSQRTVPR